MNNSSKSRSEEMLELIANQLQVVMEIQWATRGTGNDAGVLDAITRQRARLGLPSMPPGVFGRPAS